MNVEDLIINIRTDDIMSERPARTNQFVCSRHYVVMRELLKEFLILKK